MLKKTYYYTKLDDYILFHINFPVYNYIFMKNTGYANWQKTVTPPDHVASTAKGHCLLKKLTLKIKHDCQQVQLKCFFSMKVLFFPKKNLATRNYHIDEKLTCVSYCNYS